MIPGKSTFENAPALPEAGTEAVPQGRGFEAPKAPETAVEKPAQTVPIAASVAAAPVATKDETTRGVESILEEGIADAYNKMPPAAREKFKREGEKVTRDLSVMVKSLKVKANKVLALITAWLKLIPGVNKFFLIQEAKIKTDKVIALAEEEKKRRASST